LELFDAFSGLEGVSDFERSTAEEMGPLQHFRGVISI
jgi:hypothetical protein